MMLLYLGSSIIDKCHKPVVYVENYNRTGYHDDIY